MANSIALRKQYSTLLDEVYKMASLTAILDGPNEMVREGANANEILIPKLDMQGLATYNKSTGYVAGDVTLTYETKKCEYDRGRMFTVDSVDDQETAGIAFGRLSGEFLRTKVVPELDAYRFGQYASKTGIGSASGALATGNAALTALRTGRTAIENAEASVENCYLFINPAILGLIDDLDTTASRKALEGWAGIVKVPSSRFFKTVTLAASGAGGFSGATAINFLIVAKDAVIQYQKHSVSKIITPEANQDADAWKFGYRTVGIAEVYDNKLAGIYAHTAAASN